MFLFWCHFLIIFSISTSNAINRPVYKIVLNSKGYAQFIQYDVDVPTLREFTLCVWVRVTSLESDQTIFTYVGADDKRIMRLWLNGGGRQMSISIGHGRVMSSANVEFTAGAWRDVCLSYQADHGAWALYVDAALVLCEGSPKTGMGLYPGPDYSPVGKFVYGDFFWECVVGILLRGVEFPGEGSLIFGYGTSENGFPTGLSGEIYGASVILLSTIERSLAMEIRQKPIRKSKNIDKNILKTQYIVLGDLQTDEVQTAMPLTINKEYEIFPSDLKSLPLRYNMKISSRHPSHVSVSNAMNIHDFSIDEYRRLKGKGNKKYFNKLYQNDTFKVDHEFKTGLTESGTQDLPIVLEYETPPPITASTAHYSNTNSETMDDMVISDVEKPPPLEHKPKVYGQWTSTKFASNVLNYLKSIDFNMNKNQKKVQSTLPIGKLSDSYPYPSSFTYNIIRPPINYKKSKHSTEGRHTLMKRNIKGHQINVQIIKPDKSDIVLLPNKLPNPKFVEVTNRGEAKSEFKNKLHAGDNSSSRSEELEETNSIISNNSLKTRPFDGILNAIERHRGSNLLEILPFIKSKEYFIYNQHNLTKITDSNRIYSSSLSNNNKQHNIKLNNKDYGSNVESRSKHKSIVGMANINIPSVGVRSKLGESIMIGRALAKEVSNQAKQNIYNVPLLKFKHNLIPSYDPKTTTSNSIAVTVIDDYDDKDTNKQNNTFNKQVKLGNALNEQFIIGFDEQEIRNTFLGGNDGIPDINRHRSKWSSKVENIPASLHTRVCDNIELYVHEDESIGKSKIKSPVQRRNIAIEFIVQSYKQCSMKESSLKGSALIAIDWTKTPVKLFGGAHVKKTKDLCGFF